MKRRWSRGIGKLPSSWRTVTGSVRDSIRVRVEKGRTLEVGIRSLTAACIMFLACGDPPEPEDPTQPPNFILIVVDTLRADRLRFAGYEKNLSPSFDALRSESVWFRNAYATSSWTLPSMASLFTSQFVSDHRVSNWGSRLSAEHVTVVDELKRAGYRTAMWTANLLVAGRRGFADRFDHYELVEHPKFEGGPPLTEFAFGAGSSLTRHALEWLRAGAAAGVQTPFFVYLHFMEPHTPYLCADDAAAECEPRALELNRKVLNFDWYLDSVERELLDELYDAEVSRMDAALRTLLDGLEAERLLENTWLILVSDHGELLGEWDMYMHGRTLYDAVVHVPLLVRRPSGRPGLVEIPVSLIDVAPTILDLAGLAAPGSFHGRSLRPALDGGALVERPVVSELMPLQASLDPRQKHFVAVMDGHEKYVMRSDGVLQRFDLASDPDERYALAARRNRFEELLEAAGLKFDPAAYTSREVSKPTLDMREALKALGYIP